MDPTFRIYCAHFRIIRPKGDQKRPSRLLVSIFEIRRLSSPTTNGQFSSIVEKTIRKQVIFTSQVGAKKLRSPCFKVRNVGWIVTLKGQLSES